MPLDYFEIEHEVISSARLGRYAMQSATPAEDLAKYAWNMELCEAMYPLLHGFEVALRNRVHSELWRHLGYQRWFDPQRNILRKDEMKLVKGAIRKLRRNKKQPNVGRIIAELSLGFWIHLFSLKYEQLLWHSRLLHDVFPYAPRQELGIHKVRARLNRIHYLRNRVFHHEPIWHWSNLKRLHEEILETTAWLSKDWSRVLIMHDRFPAVLAAGYKPILRRIEALDD